MQRREITGLVRVLVIILLQYAVTPLQPQLSFQRTQDVTLRCDLTGFDNRVSSLLSLQLVKRAETESEDDIVLATVDSSEAWLSRDLIERSEKRHYVSGQLDLSRKRDAWLELTVINFTQNDFGTYSCQVHYTDHPADTKHTTWSRDLSVDESMSETIETAGFRVGLSNGVHISCDSGTLDESYGHVTKMNILAVQNEEHSLASWCEENNKTECSPKLLGAYHHKPRAFAAQDTLEVHFPAATCSDQSEHLCIVTTSSGKTLESSPQHLPLECQAKAEPDPLAAYATNVASVTDASSTSVDKEGTKVVIIAVSVVTVVLSAVLVLVLVLLFLKRRRKSTAKKSNDEESDTKHSNKPDESPTEPLMLSSGKGNGKENSEDVDTTSGPSHSSREDSENSKNKLIEMVSIRVRPPHTLNSSTDDDKSLKPKEGTSKADKECDSESESFNSQKHPSGDVYNVSATFSPKHSSRNFERNSSDQDTSFEFSVPVQESSGPDSQTIMV